MNKIWQLEQAMRRRAHKTLGQSRCLIIRVGRYCNKMASSARACFVFIGLATLMLSCNHLFYFPDQVERLTPKDVGLSYSEHWIPIAHGGAGQSLSAWHLAPKANAKQAVIVHFHGNAENMTSHFLYVAWLAAAGFDVVTFDYRGYGRSPGFPERESLVRDGAEVLNWVKNHPSFKGKSIIVFGQSLGGAVAIPAATLTSGISLVTVESTFDSYRTIAREKLNDIWLTWPLQYPLSYLVSDDWSPIDYVDRLAMPFLVMQGTMDPVVPPTGGKRLFARANTSTKDLWEIPANYHLPAFSADESPYKQKFVDFVCRHLLLKNCTPTK